MAKLESLRKAVNVFTGTATRHNRALREIRDLLKELNNFFVEYDTIDKVFEKVVEARVDISTLMYKIRTREKTFKQVKNKQLIPLMMDVYDKLENVRVDVYNPHKGKVYLNENLSNLKASLEALTDAVSHIEFM